jgi:hypothetical protein
MSKDIDCGTIHDAYGNPFAIVDSNGDVRLDTSGAERSILGSIPLPTLNR